jgi:C1A family cysteine protease
MRFLSVLCAGAALVFASAATMLRGTVLPPVQPSLEEIADEFADWETHYGVHFETLEEQVHRFEIFMGNHLKIWAHNLKGDETVVLAHNQFSHLTLDEFATQHLGVEVPPTWYHGWPADVQLSLNVSVLPAAVDWVAAGAVTPVKDQGQCGSCWSFSTTGALEGANYIKTGKLVSLSEQQLVDCDTVSDQGCNGGFMDDAFAYVQKNGITTEAAYPYKAVQGTCAIAGKTLAIAAGAVKGFVDVPSGDENALQAAVAQQPVSVAIQANQLAFQFYSSGVLTGTCGKRLDHGVLAVGYGVDGSTPYWKVKNSWGTGWGEGGYVRIQRGADKCGIADAASYPVM